MVKSKIKKGASKINVVDLAIKKGVDIIVDANPRLKNYESFIVKNISKKNLNNQIGELKDYLSKRDDLDDNSKEDLFYNNLVDYVSSGESLNRGAKEIILKKSILEREKKWFGGKNQGTYKFYNPIKHPIKALGSWKTLRPLVRPGRTLHGLNKLENTLGAFNNLYQLAEHQGADEIGVKKSMKTIDTLGNFASPALDVLKEYGLINNWKYSKLNKALTKRVHKESKYTIGKLQDYITDYKVAASILGLFGFGLIAASGLRLTGNVIGGVSNLGAGLIGGLFLLIATGLFLRNKD